MNKKAPQNQEIVLEEGKTYVVGDKKYILKNDTLEEIFPKVEVTARKMTAGKAALLLDISSKFVALMVDSVDSLDSHPLRLDGSDWLHESHEVYVIDGLEK